MTFFSPTQTKINVYIMSYDKDWLQRSDFFKKSCSDKMIMHVSQHE